MKRPLIVGAVLYDPAVSVTWGIICRYFEEHHVALDTVFFTNYALQVDALMRGHVDIAWNSPLAHLDSVRQADAKVRAIAMRDTDRDRCSHLVVRTGGGINNREQLRGKTIAFGAADSPQATLIPKEHLSRHGLGESDYTTKRFDVLSGLHGDHVGGELEAFKALDAGAVEASWMIDLNWNNWTKDGTVNPERYQILDTTGRYDHCVFTVNESFPRDRENTFLETLFKMDYNNPVHKKMMDLEGLKQWLPGRTTGFELLGAATQHQGFFEPK
jgi:phosphonate transport system substrate-binding protein